jgi:hypothetical protein
MTGRIALIGRAVIPLRAALLAASLSLLLSLALIELLAGGHAASSPAAARDGLASLPAAAQGPVSAALGREGSSYRVHVARGGFEAVSAGQRLHSHFTSGGVQLSSGAASVGLGLGAIGYGEALGAVEPVAPRADGNRVLYTHSQVAEWYSNGPLGLEQGFTVVSPPSAAGSGPLTLSLRLSGNARAALSRDGRSVSFRGSASTAVRYGQLVATDARGRTLTSSMQLRDGRLLLHIEDRGAAYPLSIDPLVQVAEALTVNEAAGAVGQGQLGYSVALSADGDTALVGAPADDNSAGAVWMFVRTAGKWAQQGSKLTAGEPGEPGPCGEEGGPGEESENCTFGRSVALSADGNTALVGGPRQSGPCRTGECRNQGAAWVFTRSGSAWMLQSTLTGGAEEGVEGRFGRAVALSGDGKTAVIGAPANSSGGGAAFVFTWNGSSWEQRTKLTGGEEEHGLGFFGRSVTLSADGATAVVGAPGDSGFVGAAWVFASTKEGWKQQGTKLVGAEEAGEARFGYSVALSQDGTTALVGGRRDNEGDGAAWLFARPASGEQWSQQGAKITGGVPKGGGEFGYSVALSADGGSALIGAPHENEGIGAGWLFARTPEGLTPDGPGLGGGEPRKGWFGSAVALSSDGKAALVGAPKDGGKNGSVWVFADPGTIPLLAGASPSSGPVLGGTSVTITGSRLADTSNVEFAGVEASFTVNSDSSITAIAPPHASGGARIVVTTPEGRSQGGPGAPVFTYVQAPGVGEVSPPEGPTSGGTTVTITGSHLTGTTSVSFGSAAAASFTVLSSKTISAVSPAAAAGTVTVTVATPGGAAKSHFTFVAAPGPRVEGGSGSGSPGTTQSGPGGPGRGVLGFGPLCNASLLSRTLAVLGNSRAAVKLSWRGTGACAGTLKLSVRVKAGKRVKTKTIGTGTFTIIGGRTRTVTVKLNRLGRSLLAARHGRLGASLVIVSVTGHVSTPRSASVRLAVQKKRKATVKHK